MELPDLTRTIYFSVFLGTAPNEDYSRFVATLEKHCTLEMLEKDEFKFYAISTTYVRNNTTHKSLLVLRDFGEKKFGLALEISNLDSDEASLFQQLPNKLMEFAAELEPESFTKILELLSEKDHPSNIKFGFQGSGYTSRLPNEIVQEITSLCKESSVIRMIGGMFTLRDYDGILMIVAKPEEAANEHDEGESAKYVTPQFYQFISMRSDMKFGDIFQSLEKIMMKVDAP